MLLFLNCTKLQVKGETVNTTNKELKDFLRLPTLMHFVKECCVLTSEHAGTDSNIHQKSNLLFPNENGR